MKQALTVSINVKACMLWLLPAQLIVQTYQAFENSWLILLVFGLAMSHRFAALAKRVPLATGKTKTLSLILVLAFVFFIAKQYGFLVAALSLLSFTQSLKMLEFSSQRDLNAVVCIHCFMLAACLLAHFELFHAVILALSLLLTFVAITCAQMTDVSHKQGLFYSQKLLLFSLPLALLLFFIMPRLPPLWQLPKKQQAVTGLSERLSMGSVSELSRSNRLAFRATFEGEKPQQQTLYWRALVHDVFEGNEWFSRVDKVKQPRLDASQKMISTDLTGPFWQYSVLAEPSFQQWIYTLDVAMLANNGFQRAADFSWFSRQTINQVTQYDVRSYYQASLTETHVSKLHQLNTQLPPVGNERTRAWIKKLKKQFSQPEELIDYLLTHFNKQDFHYSLKPPLLGNEAIDEFLFQTQVGFCGHYASAFTFMMRAAGIPARVVAGYLGGEWNPQGQYLSVYQYDAHAWSEVYLEGQGWIRVDPTASVAPERVAQDLATAFQNEFLPDTTFSLVKYKHNWLIGELRFALANMNYQWTRWIVNYNQKTRADFWQNIQQFNWKNLLKLIMYIGLLIVLSFLFFHYQKFKQAGIAIVYRRALSYLAAAGIEKTSGQTANELSVWVKRDCPKAHDTWVNICHTIEQHTYRPSSDISRSKLLKKLNKQVGQLKRDLKIYLK